MSVSCNFNGRLGNIIYNMCQVIAYCKKHDLQYWFPTFAWACIDQKVPIHIENTGEQPNNPILYHEPVDNTGSPYYHDIPKMEQVIFQGYYQSFKYFEQYRKEILNVFNFPNVTEYGIVSIGVRRGDVVAQPDAFPMAPTEYYHSTIKYMQDKGYNKFRLYSDDNPWCMEEFTPQNYPGAIFEFYEEGTDFLKKYISLIQCEHNISSRSTFELTAGWMNQNPNKIVLCPTIEKKWWSFQNRDLLSDTNDWLTQIIW